MNHGFVLCGCSCVPIRVADCGYNAEQIVKAVQKAAGQGVEVLCLPELCVTGYTCEDLFFQPALLNGVLDALQVILKETADLSVLFAVGAPLRHNGKLYNCAIVIQHGKILGVVPKTHLPNYNEFYEQRHFDSAPEETDAIHLFGQEIPFGTKLLFASQEHDALKVAVEICEDLWAPVSPGTAHALAGATIVMNLSASDEIIGKAAYRKDLVSAQSARLLCGYLYADAGEGESTTDLVFAGHHLIAENGTVLAQSKPFANEDILVEIDVERLSWERSKNTTFPRNQNQGYAVISFHTENKEMPLHRGVSPAPFVPQEQHERFARCEAILEMQAQGLKKRLLHTRSTGAVVGISGGLDSTLALLVVTRAFSLAGLPLEKITAVTMPCFGTTSRTKNNAYRLCEALGVTLREVNIAQTVRSNFADIGHDEACLDVTYENTQARVRTLVLMNLANQTGGLVIGTGDLSELALGWATYNGDHMSMYGVNASVPKTLVRHLVATVAQQSGGALQEVLEDILDTPVSPELLPAKDGEISQKTEELVGPYELHDFFLYYVLRWAFEPKKIFYLAKIAFEGQYDEETIRKWLQNFYRRFFAQQFKRSCLPDGPKVGTVALSPRGDWRMPSDACANLWLDQLERL